MIRHSLKVNSRLDPSLTPHLTPTADLTPHLTPHLDETRKRITLKTELLKEGSHTTAINVLLFGLVVLVVYVALMTKGGLIG